ncbi:MAG: hypothetical protein PHT02_07050 [Tissierellia bacterium]|nr:hypothetical protein [Tissierellia bacterium]
MKTYKEFFEEIRENEEYSGREKILILMYLTQYQTIQYYEEMKKIMGE